MASALSIIASAVTIATSVAGLMLPADGAAFMNLARTFIGQILGFLALTASGIVVAAFFDGLRFTRPGAILILIAMAAMVAQWFSFRCIDVAF
ncbi:MAG TPA: hypothetical protein PLU30_23130 [Verrucomicrobiae bacterium]|nr:hypothetical protein [Verrucomicrobiae bacterium]